MICDLLLNQNLGASAEKYDGKVPINCNFLFGPTFALLRSEFRDWRERSFSGRLDRNIENILITMGGSDAENYTLLVLKGDNKKVNTLRIVDLQLFLGCPIHTQRL